MADLQSFLEGVRLAQYYNALTGLGVSTPADVSMAEDADLVGIGMKKIEINRLRRGIAPGAEMAKEVMASAPQMVQAVPAAMPPAAMAPGMNSSVMAPVATGGADVMLQMQMLQMERDRQERQEHMDKQERMDRQERAERAERQDRQAGLERAHGKDAHVAHTTNAAIANSAPQMVVPNYQQTTTTVGVQGLGMNGLFDCFDDIGVCCCGYFCGACRAGQTHERAGLSSGPCWKIPVFCIGGSVANLCYVGWMCQCIAFRWICQGRQQIQAMSGVTPDDDCTACMMYLFCGPCAVCQEANAIDKMWQANGCKNLPGPGAAPMMVVQQTVGVQPMMQQPMMMMQQTTQANTMYAQVHQMER